jgi:cold shock CspA family protein
MATDSVTSTTLESLTGRVKWFNNKAGYGFITITDGSRSGTDVFVHHSSINVSDQQYKYLVQGEYVQFTLSSVSTGAHEFQASSVSGINGGKLMCETRHEFKSSRKSYKTTSVTQDNESVSEPVKQVREPKTPRSRGEGPRDAEKGSWTVVENKTATQKPKGRGRPPKATVSTSEEK